jgi:hypothetical protein
VGGDDAPQVKSYQNQPDFHCVRYVMNLEIINDKEELFVLFFIYPSH